MKISLIGVLLVFTAIVLILVLINFSLSFKESRKTFSTNLSIEAQPMGSPIPSVAQEIEYLVEEYIPEVNETINGRPLLLN